MHFHVGRATNERQVLWESLALKVADQQDACRTRMGNGHLPPRFSRIVGNQTSLVFKRWELSECMDTQAGLASHCLSQTEYSNHDNASSVISSHTRWPPMGVPCVLKAKARAVFPEAKIPESIGQVVRCVSEQMWSN